jgi:hypothetical protein
VIHLLERADGKKWYIWNKQGRVTSDNFTTKINEYFEKYEAINKFCEYFNKKTGNKWSDRMYFQHKPGLYMLLNKESEADSIKKYQEFERELVALMKAGEGSF